MLTLSKLVLLLQVPAAVARVAMETGIARIKVDPEEVRANTMKRVGR